MIAAALTILTSAAPASDVASFFPLNPGDEYSFHTSGAGLSDDSVDTVGKPVEINGKLATPIASKDPTGVETTYYQIEEDKILVVAFDPKAPLKEPYTIVHLKGRGQKWNFLGDTVYMGAPAALKMEGKSRLIGERDVLGQKVEVLEVVLDATVVDEQASSAMNNVVGFKTKQTALYARGIGLYEMTTEATLGRKKSTTTRKLTKYKKAG